MIAPYRGQRPESAQPQCGARNNNRRRPAEGVNVTDVERNKQVVRAPYEAAQRQAVPVTLPGVAEEPSVPKADPSTVISCQDAPGGVNEPMATIAAIVGWQGQTVSPGFTAYGPMIAEGDLVAEEWETFFHGRDGTI